MPDDPTALTPSDPARWRADLEAWRAGYEARLAAADGWWAVAGLTWLDDAPARVGSATDAEVRLPIGAPTEIATVAWTRGAVLVRTVAGARLWHAGRWVQEPVRIDAHDATFALGPDAAAARFTVLVRGARRGVRVHDPAQAAARVGRGVGWFEPAPSWRRPARFEAGAHGERLAIVNVQGDVLDTPVAGRLAFTLDGALHRLVATWSGERLFVNFRDATSGLATYGAGRFLTLDAPVDAHAVIDFNRAHHPPCAHTAFATCPLPPLENRLTLAVTAGERHEQVAAAAATGAP